MEKKQKLNNINHPNCRCITTANPYPEFNSECIIPKEYDVSTVSETPSSIIYSLILQFCKN